MNRRALVSGIQVVGVLFAAFGGFFAGIAPPETADAKFGVGISSFFVLIVLFAISALATGRNRKKWIAAAGLLIVIAAVAAFSYKASYDSLTFEYPPGDVRPAFIAGTELTPIASDYQSRHAGISNSQLLASFGGIENRGKVWPQSSINSAKRRLVALYVMLVLSISSAVFSLTEGALGKAPRSKSRAKNPRKSGGTPKPPFS